MIKPTPIGVGGNDVPLNMLLTLMKYMFLCPLARKISTVYCAIQTLRVYGQF